MREILFRGKRIDKGAWVEGNYWANQFGNHFIRVNVIDCDYTIKDYEVIPETVGQSTGLTDKNGKKIFEGDIIEYWQDERYVNKTIIEHKDCWFGTNPIRESYCCLIYMAIKWHNAKVIGNTHDNPELLEEA